jgi:hypothetical protein
VGSEQHVHSISRAIRDFHKNPFLTLGQNACMLTSDTYFKSSRTSFEAL